MNTRAHAADNNGTSAIPATVTATVLDSTDWGIGADRKLRPIRLEVEGDVYTLDNDQAKARVDRDRSAPAANSIPFWPIGLTCRSWPRGRRTTSRTA